MAPPPIPANDARAIFTAAEDYNIAHWEIAKGAARNPRMIVPQITYAAFAIELYLKCVLVDSGSTTVPAKHDLIFIFRQLSKKRRSEIRKAWKEFHASTVMRGDSPESTPDEIESILTESANSFDHWRYRYQYDASILKMQAVLIAVIRVLHDYVISLHPDWEDGGAYFRSTFPIPKSPT